MKKRIGVVLCAVMLIGCSEKASPPMGVTEVVWLQEDDSDYRLFLGEDRSVSYYSPGAGNPYHDFDLCEHYAYNEKSKVFSFEDDACSMEFLSIEEKGEKLRLLVDGEEITYLKEK